MGIEKLDTWQIDPMTADFLVLDAVEFVNPRNGDVTVKSIENRRLYCLQKHQEHVRPWLVYMRVRCTRLPPDKSLQRFFDRCEVNHDGATIEIEPSRVCRALSR